MDISNCSVKRIVLVFSSKQQKTPQPNQEWNPNLWLSTDTTAEKTKRTPPQTQTSKFFLFIVVLPYFITRWQSPFSSLSPTPPPPSLPPEWTGLWKGYFSHASSMAWNKLLERGKTSFFISTLILYVLLTLNKQETQYSPTFSVAEASKKTSKLIHTKCLTLHRKLCLQTWLLSSTLSFLATSLLKITS